MTLSDFVWPDDETIEAARVCGWPLEVVPIRYACGKTVYLVTYRPPSMCLEEFYEMMAEKLNMEAD